jgi:hypothetical protein
MAIEWRLVTALHAPLDVKGYRHLVGAEKVPILFVLAQTAATA